MRRRQDWSRCPLRELINAPARTAVRAALPPIADEPLHCSETTRCVESRCGAVALGRAHANHRQCRTAAAGCTADYRPALQEVTGTRSNTDTIRLRRLQIGASL